MEVVTTKTIQDENIEKQLTKVIKLYSENIVDSGYGAFQ